MDSGRPPTPGDGDAATGHSAEGVAARFGDALRDAPAGAYHLHDFDGAAYDGDVGELAATHPESHKLGFEDRAAFDRKVDALRDDEAVSRGAEFAAILERDATVGLEEVARIVNEAQEPGRLREGFRVVTDAVDRAWVVTAGPVAPPGRDCLLGAEHVLDAVGHDVPVVGSVIEDDPAGGVSVRRFCGREEKVPRVEAVVDGALAHALVAAVGDSPTDSEMLRAADQSWALGADVLDAATIDATADRAYRAVAVSELLVDGLAGTGAPPDRVDRARDRAGAALGAHPDWDLPPLQTGPRADSLTDLVMALYAELDAVEPAT
ncbi:MAG: HAD family hydrolase [Halobacteriaceae archaeon]